MSREDRQKRKLKFYNKWQDALEVRLAELRQQKQNLKNKYQEMNNGIRDQEHH